MYELRVGRQVLRFGPSVGRERVELCWTGGAVYVVNMDGTAL